MPRGDTISLFSIPAHYGAVARVLKASHVASTRTPTGVGRLSVDGRIPRGVACFLSASSTYIECQGHHQRLPKGDTTDYIALGLGRGISCRATLFVFRP